MAKKASSRSRSTKAGGGGSSSGGAGGAGAGGSSGSSGGSGGRARAAADAIPDALREAGRRAAELAQNPMAAGASSRQAMIMHFDTCISILR